MTSLTLVLGVMHLRLGFGVIISPLGTLGDLDLDLEFLGTGDLLIIERRREPTGPSSILCSLARGSSILFSLNSFSCLGLV